MKNLSVFVVFLLGYLGMGGALAQPQQYKFNKVGIAEGLSNSQVKAVFKDSKGFVWIGTVSGLNRFDGYSVKIFLNDPRDTTTIHDSDVTRLFEDPDGNIWITTWTGPSVYNAAKERFQRDTRALLKKFGVPEGTISNIYKDKSGKFWFMHATQGLYRYDPQTKQSRAFQHADADSSSVFSNLVASMAEDSKGNLWLLHKQGVLEKMDGHTGRILHRVYGLKKLVPEENAELQFMVDADDELWIYANNFNKGLIYFTPQTEIFKVIDKNSESWKLNTDIVRGVVQDNRGLIWVGTDHGGVNILDKKKLTVSYVLNNPEDGKSIGQNSISVLYKDGDGFIWAGTFKSGVSYFHENSIRFTLYRHKTSDGSSLPFNDINAFAEDRKGNLWIGTNGGGLIYYDRAANSFKQFLHQPGDPGSLSNNVIVSLFYDRDDKLWIGTYFGGLNCYDGKKFTRYWSYPGGLGDNSIWEIFEDSKRNLWIGTLSNGVDRYDKERKKFTHFRNGDGTLHASYIPAFMEDRAGNLWIGTGYGIDVHEKSGKYTFYINQYNNPETLSNNMVMSIIEDGFGKIWIGTKEGLNLFEPRTRTFRSFSMREGLPHNTVLTIVEDLNKNLWIGTPNGISNLVLERDAQGEPVSFEFRNYDQSDGLQGRQFNENAAMRTRRGELVFGGSGGFNLFRPEDIVLNTNRARVILTDFQIFNRSVAVGEEIDGRVVLEKSIAETTNLVLKHSDNVFSIEFAALSFLNPEKTRYKYMLEGFSKDWLETNESQRRVTYTNLDPGKYAFKVFASNNDGVWSEVPTRLAITVLPPFWKTRTAFVLYVIAVLLALLLSRKLIQERERMKYRIRQERQDARQLHELDMMKLKFFTNVSHEFRTPLTLILTPLEKILRQTADPDQKKQFQMIHRNARRLLNLVNQLLDFRKMEVQEVKLNPSEGDIIAFIRESIFSFSDLSEKKNIALTFHGQVDSIQTVFDRDKLEKILFNLLSNAFKFTPDNGSVEVSVDAETGEASIRQLRIRVKDTGIGIPADMLGKVFERFFQSELPGSMVNQGSGIGLSITREFVRAHGGSISVESELNQGTCFTVKLPVQEIAAAHAKTMQNQPEETPEAEVEIAEEPTIDGVRKPVILLVEDNEDFRFYLKDNLKFQYKIIEATHGALGFLKAKEHIPDLVVSDVMMPEMSGIELCKKIKTEKTTSHIPVILLTARAAEEQKLEGFDSGADDYITKPFSFEILQSRIKNLIHQRERFQKDLRKQIEIRASDLHITSLDEKLIQNAIRVVELSLSDSDFSVEDLSRELAMSRVHLYKKLQALTGKSPLEFIRTIRLQHAAQLLAKSQLSVSEVAYKVGFNNPKYFARYFREEYHVLPSAYAHGKRGE